MAKDLVCGMMVDEKSPPARLNYKGKDYYFCSEGCKHLFEKQPERYLVEEKERKEEPED